MKRFLFIGGFGLAVAMLALALIYFTDDETAPDARVAVDRSAPAAPSNVARNSGIPVPSPPPVATYRPGKQAEKKAAPAAPEPEAPVVSKPKTPAARATPPSFDVVRISPAGDAVIAGRAAPKAQVTIHDGGKLIGTVTADDRGDWVYLPTEPLPSGERELSLSARNVDGVETGSQSVVVLAVPDRAANLAASEPTKEMARALAVLVSRDGSKPSRVLQKPTEPRGVGGKDLSIGIVDYDEKGNVNIGGKGKPGEGVQVYVDNRLVGRSKVGPKGNWSVGPKKEVEPGVHKLRVDATRKGKVVSRVEIPFSRAKPEIAKQDKSRIVVQPGNSLWRIARRTLGKGVRYVEIYNANASMIVDPDLIYPGQVFSLPRTH